MARSETMKGFLHVPVSTRLRAPRIAIIVPEIDPWQYFASLVLERASRIWGGAGFILIPHKDGIVNPQILRMTAAYDPDHIVTVMAPGADLVDLRSDIFRVTIDGDLATSEQLRSIDSKFKLKLSGYDRLALESATAACSPFLAYGSDGDGGAKVRNILSHLVDSIDEVMEAADLQTDESSLALSSRNSRTKDLAVLRASKSGLTKGYEHPTSGTDTDPNVLFAICRDLLEIDPWDAQVPKYAWTLKKRWGNSLAGLVSVSRDLRNGEFYVVVGDTFSDFALAHGLERLSGHAQWIPKDWIEKDSEFQSSVSQFVSRLQIYHSSQDISARIISISSDAQSILETIRAMEYVTRDPEDDGRWLTAIEVQNLEYERTSSGFLALEKDFDRDFVLPAQNDGNNSISFVNRIPAILPETQEVLHDRSREWILDLEILDSQMPRGRGLRGELLEKQDSPWHERLRSGRDGHSLMSRSFGFVSSRSTLRQSLARPRIRTLGLIEWVVQMAEAKGWEAVVSDAGQKAQSAARLWGGRESMAEDLSDMYQFFAEFKGNGEKRTDVRYPFLDGDIVDNDGYLTFGAARRILNGVGRSDVEVRTKLDQLIGYGVLRRGLILRCQECAHLQWLSLVEMNPTAKCRRCQGEISINHKSWRSPIEEPSWYYDLHPIVRSMLNQDGDVPILAGRKLQAEIRGGEVIPEMEFRKGSEHRIEIDLIFGSPHVVIIGEAKTTSNIRSAQRKKKIDGLALVAELLQADRVVLASGGTGEWNESVVEEMKSRAKYISNPSGKFLDVRCMSGLRESG